MFHYCPHCGLISGSVDDECPVCEYTMEPVPAKYLSAGGNLFASQAARNDFLQQVVEKNTVFVPELAAGRDDILIAKKEQRQAEVQNMVEEYLQKRPTHRCPVCSSQNLSRISNAGKVAKIALIGVWGAGDLGKQWRCNSCGHKF